ncbi:hypothetical protein GCK32_018660, partial [Trichostrongylus colubriformis]
RYASELVNTSDEQLPTAVRALEVQIAPRPSTPNALVICAMDSRESGPHLIEAAKAGAALMGVPYESHGVLTTPQLHYIVRCKNDPSFGDAREIGYYARISDAFKKLQKDFTAVHSPYAPDWKPNRPQFSLRKRRVRRSLYAITGGVVRFAMLMCRILVLCYIKK